MVKEINYTAQELKQAQTIISDYLFNSLLRVQPGTKVRLGSLGWLVKKSDRLTMEWAILSITIVVSKNQLL